MEEIIKILNKNIHTSSLTEVDKFNLAKISKVKKFNKNNVVFSADQKGNCLYLVESGRLLLQLSGKPQKVYSKGEIFGELALLSKKERLGTITALESATAYAIDRDHLYSKSFPQSTLINFIQVLTNQVISYIDSPKSSSLLIEEGENDFVEFKKTIGEPNMYLIIRVIVSFLNSKGGVLFAGVDDNRNITGLRGLKDYKSREKYGRLLHQRIVSELGGAAANLVSIDFEEIESKIILRIDSLKSPIPIFIKEGEKGKEETRFYCRIKGSNHRITNQEEFFKYIKHRF